MRGVGFVGNLCVILKQKRARWCEVLRRSPLSLDEGLRRSRRRNFASSRPDTLRDTGRFFDQRTELVFSSFAGFWLSPR